MAKKTNKTNNTDNTEFQKDCEVLKEGTIVANVIVEMATNNTVDYGTAECQV